MENRSRRSSSGSIDPEVEKLFLDFLEASSHGEEAFEEFWRAHPSAADQLIELYRNWAWLEDLVGPEEGASSSRSSQGESTEERFTRLEGRAAGSDRYHIVGELGMGGMGIVFEVEDLDLRRRLAMKVARVKRDTNGSGSGGQRALSRFLEEAQITGQLDHPGVVPIHDLGVDPRGHVFFTMKKVEGDDLASVTRHARAEAEGWNLSRLLGVLVKVCQTVAYAHEKGVVHRDLKPSNVMVGSFGEVFVLDWGLAKVLPEGNGVDAIDPISPSDSASGSGSHSGSIRTDRAEDVERTPDSPIMTHAGAVLGTPYFMSPEQATADPDSVGPPTDVYALGAILYTMLAGHRPYEEGRGRREAGRVVDRIVQGPPSPLRGSGPWFHPELVAICNKAMSRDVEARYGGALDMARDLEAFLEGRAVSAHRTGPWVDLRKWILRNRTIAIAVGLVLVLLIVGPTLLTIQTARTNRLVAGERSIALLQGYVASLSAAEAAMRIHDVPEARRRLEAAPPSLRGWEWDHFGSRVDQSVASRRFDGWVTSVAFDPGSERIAIATKSGPAEVWDRALARREAVLDGDGVVVTAEFLPDGALLTGSPGGTFRVHDLEAGKVLREWSWSRSKVVGFVLSPEEARVAVFGGPHLEVLDVTTGKPIAAMVGHDYGILSVRFSADGRRLVSGGHDSRVRIWDAATGDCIDTIDGFERKVESVAFTDRGRAVFACNLGASIRSLHGEGLRGAGPRERSVVFGAADPLAPDRFLLVREDKSLAWWNWVEGRIEGTLRGHEQPVTAIAIARDGQSMVTGGYDGLVKVWDRAITGDVRTLQGHTNYVRAVAFDPTGTKVASVGWNYRIKIWDVASGLDVLTHHADHHVQDAAFHPEEPLLAYTTRSGQVVLLDGESGREVFGAKDPGSCDVLAFSADGRWLATGSSDGSIRVREAGTGRLERVFGVEAPVFDVAFSRSGSRFAASTGDGRILLWDPTSWERRETIPVEPVSARSLAFRPESDRLYAGMTDGELVIFERVEREWRPVGRSRGHSRDITAISFHPEGRRFATASRDRAILIWDVGSRTVVARLLGHNWWVNSVDFSPDGTRLASGSQDCTVRLWETEPLGRGATLRRSATALRREAGRLLPADADLRTAEELLTHLRASEVEDEALRTAARALARARGGDPVLMTPRTWATVLDSGAGAEAWSEAHERAILARGLEPNRQDLIRVFGAAQIRRGRFEDGLHTLSLLAEGEEPDPRGAAGVFRALALVGLDRLEDAEEELRRARGPLTESGDRVCQRLFQEVEGLLEARR